MKAIIFDCFGVLVRGSLEEFRAEYLGDDVAKQTQMHDLDAAANRGVISYDEFIDKAAELAGIEPSQVRKFLDNTPPNKALLGHIRNQLKPDYKIGMLSNAADDWLNDLFTREEQELFDDVVLSYRYGLSKPDRRIYELAATNLGVEPHECIFVDDIERYCEAAREVGMQAIQFRTTEQVIHDIANLLRRQ